MDLQRDALWTAGVDEANLYHDFASGRRDDRPGARQLLASTPERRRARRLEARPPRPQPRPFDQHRAGPAISERFAASAGATAERGAVARYL